jgi:hypothetical protein
MEYTLKEFKANVIQWSTEREIIQNGSITGQNQKIREECSEVSAEIQKFIDGRGDLDLLKKEIGDIAVLLINVNHMQKSNSDFTFDHNVGDKVAYVSAILALSRIWSQTVHAQECYTLSWELLMGVCWRCKVNLSECAYLAFKKIEHRKGKFCKESMSWVKES